MKPLTHFILGLVFSVLVYLFFKISFLEFSVLFLSTWLFIDLDLAFIFIFKEKSINPIKFLRWAEKRREYFLSLTEKERKNFVHPLRFFHSIEFLILLIAFSLFNKLLFFVFFGFIFHLILDWVDLYKLKLDIFHKITWFYHLKKNKKA